MQFPGRQGAWEKARAHTAVRPYQIPDIFPTPQGRTPVSALSYPPDHVRHTGCCPLMHR